MMYALYEYNQQLFPNLSLNAETCQQLMSSNPQLMIRQRKDNSNIVIRIAYNDRVVLSLCLAASAGFDDAFYHWGKRYERVIDTTWSETIFRFTLIFTTDFAIMYNAQ